MAYLPYILRRWRIWYCILFDSYMSLLVGVCCAVLGRSVPCRAGLYCIFKLSCIALRSTHFTAWPYIHINESNFQNNIGSMRRGCVLGISTFTISYTNRFSHPYQPHNKDFSMPILHVALKFEFVGMHTHTRTHMLTTIYALISCVVSSLFISSQEVNSFVGDAIFVIHMTASIFISYCL